MIDEEAATGATHNSLLGKPGGQGVVGSNPSRPTAFPLTTSRQVVGGFVISGGFDIQTDIHSWTTGDGSGEPGETQVLGAFAAIVGPDPRWREI